MKEYFYCALLTSAACTLFGMAPVFRSRKSVASGTLCLFFLSIAVWSLGLALHTISTEPSKSAVTEKIMHYGLIWIPTLFLHFIYSFLEKGKSKILALTYTLAVLFTILNYSGWVTAEPVKKIDFQLFVEPGQGYPFLLIYFAGTTLFGLFMLFNFYSKSEGLNKNQAKFILGSTLLCLIGVTSNFLPVYNLWYYPFNPYATLLIMVSIGGLVYAIMAFRLFDFNLLFRWGLAYSLLVGLVFGALSLVLAVFDPLIMKMGAPRGASVLITACLLVFAFDPLRKRINTFVDQFIFKSPDFQSILDGIHKTLENPSNIKTLTKDLSEEMKKIWNISHVGLVLWNQNHTAYNPYPEEEFSNYSISKSSDSITRENYLVKTLETERRIFKHGIVTVDEVNALSQRSSAGPKATLGKIKSTMESLGAHICVPLLSKVHLSGFVVLGPKKNNSLYNNEDKKFLQHVAQLISIAFRELIFGHGTAQGNIKTEPKSQANL